LEAIQFPAEPYLGMGYFHWKIPVPAGLVSGASARPRFQAICAQIMIDASLRLASLKPKSLQDTRVVVILGYPDLFQSEICVFFTPEYFASFCSRNSDDFKRIARPDLERVARWNLSIPDGFDVRGFDTYQRDDSFDPPFEEWGEMWLIGEVAD
jgi:hypothetical protein